MSLDDMLNTGPEDDLNQRLQQIIEDAIDRAEPHYHPNPPLPFALKDALADDEPDSDSIMAILRHTMLPERWDQPAYDYVVLPNGTVFSRRDLSIADVPSPY